MQACELAVYVTPEHRGRTGMRLIKAFEAWAWDRGADEITLGISTEVDPERTAALYARLGYRRSGITTIKRREH
jgi:GNAT superfamily N-acetyltransferase